MLENPIKTGNLYFGDLDMRHNRYLKMQIEPILFIILHFWNFMILYSFFSTLIH